MALEHGVIREGCAKFESGGREAAEYDCGGEEVVAIHEQMMRGWSWKDDKCPPIPSMRRIFVIGLWENQQRISNSKGVLDPAARSRRVSSAMEIQQFPPNRAFSTLAVLAVVFLISLRGVSALGGEFVGSEPSADRFPLADGKTTADIHVSEDDWKVAKIAAGDLVADVERVTGRRPGLKHTTDGLSENVVMVGTIGRSRVIDGLIAAGKLDVSGLAGEWESFVIEMIADPLPA